MGLQTYGNLWHEHIRELSMAGVLLPDALKPTARLSSDEPEARSSEGAVRASDGWACPRSRAVTTGRCASNYVACLGRGVGEKMQARVNTARHGASS